MPVNEWKELYIDPRTDFGFKYLFGTPMNKELLIGFLNALFHGTHIITDLTYLNGEQLGLRKEDRRAIFDVYCETESGEKFIVEMQNVFQQFFKDRSVYYSTKVFYDKLTFIYLELPKFTKTEDELETLFEKWVFVLKNLSRLLERPVALQERVFKRLFEAASIARFTPKELQEYEESVKAYRDIVNAVNTARSEGLEEGLEKGLEKGLEQGLEKGHEEEKMEIARKMKSDGLPDDIISKYTGLPIEEIEKILLG